MTAVLARSDAHSTVDPPARPAGRHGIGLVPTAVLLLGALYCLVPVAWVLVAASKNKADLFDTSTFAPGWSLLENIGDLSSYRDGLFWRWMANTALYAGVGAALSAFISGLSGYTLSKFRFPGRTLLFNVLLAGVLVPAIVLAIPQYLLLAKLGVAGSYWSTWIDNMSTALMTSTGSCDDQGKCEWHATYTDPMTGQQKTARMTSEHGADTELHRSYEAGEGGAERLSMEFKYTRSR